MTKHYRIWGVLLFATSCLFLITAGCGQLAPIPATQKEWTVMFYAAGDNDLESYILNNVIQLQKAGSTSQVNIVAETDWYHHDGTSTTLTTGEGVGRWYIEKSSSTTSLTSKLVGTLQEINTGSAASVKDFVLWAVQNYPAKHYMLVMSSHGGGWKNSPPLKARGLGQDYTSDTTKQLLITLPDFKTILPDIKSTLGKKIDIIACDACLNGMVEVAYQFKDYADYLVASEEIVPGYGFPWDTIAISLVADPTRSPRDVTIDIVNKYYTSYNQQTNTTIAAIDLSKIDAVASQFKTFAALFDTSAKLLAFKNLVNSGTNYDFTIQRYYDATFRDAWDMADKIITYMSSDASYNDIVAKCTDLKNAIRDSVILSRYTSGIPRSYTVYNSYGLAIYIPTPETIAYDTEYNKLDFTAFTGWGDFLQKLK